MPGSWPAGGIWLAVEPTDMRRSFDGPVALVATRPGENPASGRWYVFVNRRRTMVKVLGSGHGGYLVRARRLERGLFASPPAPAPGRRSLSLSRTGPAALLDGTGRHHRPAPPQAPCRPRGGLKPQSGRGGRDVGRHRGVGKRFLPAPRRQPAGPAGGVAVDPQRHVDQPDAGVDALHPAGGEHGVHDPRVLRPQLRPAKQPVALAELRAAQFVLDPVRVRRHVGIDQERLQRGPSPDGVGDRPADRVPGRRRRILQRTPAPVPEPVDRRARAGPPRHQPPVRRTAPDPLPGPVDGAGQRQRLPGHLRVIVPPLPEVAAGVDPAPLVGDRAAARREMGPAGAVAVAHEGSGAPDGEPGGVPVPAGRGEGEHHPAPVAGHRPQVSPPHASRPARVPSGPDQRPGRLYDGAPGTERHRPSWTGPGARPPGWPTGPSGRG